VDDSIFDFPDGEHFSLVGATGAGKTELVKSAILPRRSRFIIIDTKVRANGDSVGFPEKAFIRCDDDKKAIRIAKDPKKKFRLRIPMTERRDELILRVEKFSYDLFHSGSSEVLVYFDEVTDFSTAWQIGPELENLVRKGRALDLSCGVGSQKPQGLNGWFVDNSAHIYVFGMRTSEQVRFTKNTGRAWVEELLPQMPVGSHKFAYEDWQGAVTLYDPVEKFDWTRVR
jgi:energy-coupling factor transporter ATP-binding protein EcfA2